MQAKVDFHCATDARWICSSMNTVLFLADGANTSAEFIENIYLIFCSSMNKLNLLLLTNTQLRQTTVNEHAYGAQRIHALV